MIACGRVRPASTSSSSTLSNVAESEPPGRTIGRTFCEVVAEQLGGELRLARAHPVDVAAQRVDLAVVRDVTVRVRELPARERVGGEAGVHQRERALRPRVLQVRVVAQQLRGREHALVDDRAARERRDHEVRAGGQLGHAADHVELALERVLVARELRRGRHDELLDVRGEPVGGDPDVVLLDRDVAPGHDALALGLHRGRQQLLELGAALLLLGQEADGDAVLARRRQVGPDHPAQQLVGQLQQHPRAVAGVGVGAGRAAVLEVLEGGDRPLDRLVARVAAQPRDERDAAGVVLVCGVIETDRLGRPLAWRQDPAPERRGVGTGKRKGSSEPTVRLLPPRR